MTKLFAVLVSVMLLFAASGCTNQPVTSEKLNNGETKKASDSKTVSEEESKKTYHIGEEVLVSTKNGEYKIKFTGIEETDERNQFSETKADRVVILSYEYENISLNNDLYISDFNFKLYDKENNALDSYPANVKYPDSVGIGRKTSAQVAYALNSLENYIELEYYDNIIGSKSNFKVVLEW